MIITIDTAKDSKDDIRKLIAFLSTLHDNVSVASSEISSQAADVFADMFGGSNPTITTTPIAGDKPTTALSTADLLASAGDDDSLEQKDEDTPQVILY